MLNEIFNEQRRHLEYFFENLDREKAEAFLQACLSCEGIIVFTGVGKSGLIAEKIAMTLISTGTRALYLPTTNFLHGDIGILSPQDLIVMLSKSGETEELLNLVPYVRKRGAQILTVVSNPHSRLGREGDVSIVLPVAKELCPFDLAPTTSTEVQLLFGDALAMALMRSKEFSLAEYAENHPSGTIGKKMTLRVQDLMFKGEDVPFCRPHDRLVDVLVELSNKRCGCLLIADQEQQLLGIFTDGDLRRALQRHGGTILQEMMENIMTPAPIAVSHDLLAWDVLRIMQKDPKKWIFVTPVVDHNKVVGIVRMHDIVHAGLSG